MSFPETRLTLIERLASGGTAEDWQGFLRDYWGPVCRFALRSGAGQLSDAEDVASQTFEVLWESRLLVRWIGHRTARLRSLLCSVTRKTLANRQRVRAGRQRLARDAANQWAQPEAVEDEQSDPEFCPPELALDTAIELPAGIEAAAVVLRQQGLAANPRRVDVYQLGVLLCQLLTGETLLSYRYSTSVKAKVPLMARAVLDRCLGEGATAPLTDCEGLIEALDEVLRQCEDELPPSIRETPARGSGVAILAETPPLGSAVATPAGRSSVEEVPFERLGHFEIVQRIGHGGMGDVYKGYDASLDRYVAIKVLPAALARDEDFVRRFHTEATAVAKLAHPNVVPIHFIGQDAGHHFFAMQFIEGESLGQRLARQQRLPVAEAAVIIEQCLAGLEAAHAQGLVHRDVKPGNVLLDRRSGQAVLVDFGLVRQMGAESQMTATGVVMGTVDYIAPEQARGQHVDGRSDIYSLGVMFYQLLAGRLPFAADTPTAMIFQHAYEAPFPLTKAAPDVPQPVVEIIARMMAKDPAERYDSCAAVLADLRAFRVGRIAKSVKVAGTLRVPSAPGDENSGRHTECACYSTDGESLPVPSSLSPVPFPLLPADTPWQRAKDWAATIFRRHAPQALQELQSTTQQVDGAVAEYERRSKRLKDLLDEARGMVAELAAQIPVTEQAAQELEVQASKAEDPEAIWDKLRVCQEDLAALRVQRDEQHEQIEQLKLELGKAGATLARLRSQRDLLKARLHAAGAQQQLDGGRPASARRRPAVLALIGVFAGVLAVMAIAKLRDRGVGRPAGERQAAVALGGRGIPGIPKTPTPVGALLANYLCTETDDFVIDAYHNGEPIPEDRRHLLHDSFGATGEKIDVQVREGDWMVFNVASNRFRWDGACYFAVLGMLGEKTLGFTSDLQSGRWSCCDDPSKVPQFIAQREYLASNAAQPVTRPWEGGPAAVAKLLPDWKGEPVWGKSRNTWIKFIATSKKLGPGRGPPPPADQDFAEPGPAAGVAASLPQASAAEPVVARYIHTVAKFFVVDVYHNGKRVPDGKRHQESDTCGKAAETVNIQVRRGDWVVFNVVNHSCNGGSSYFAALGMLDDKTLGFTTGTTGGQWSFCDNPAQVRRFVTERDYGASNAVLPIDKPWWYGPGLVAHWAPGWTGQPVWGKSRNTWIKFIANRPSPAVAPFDEKKAKAHQEAWANYLGVPVQMANSIGMKLALIPPGEFAMGSPKELIEEESRAHAGDGWYWKHLPGEVPQHRVRITKPFYLGMCQVTQEEYERVMGSNPSGFKGDPKGPVERVSWDDAAEFCRRLSELPEEKGAQRRYGLPTEAQWEHACRAGNPGPWYFSPHPGPVPAGWAEQEKLLGEYAWFSPKAGEQTHAVGQKRANAWGLYDMYGNVWQWCQDWYDSDYYVKSPTDDPTGPPGGSARAIRGGCWNWPGWNCRSAHRDGNAPGDRDNYVGFRACMVLAVASFEAANAKPSEEIAKSDRSPAPAVTIIAARWGGGQNWVDVTARVKELVDAGGDIWVNSQTLNADPTPHWRKHLEISYVKGGSKKEIEADEDQLLDSPDFRRPAADAAKPVASSLIGADGKWNLPAGAPPPAIAPFDKKKAKEHQECWAEHLGVPVEIANSIGMKLVLVPPGEFDMGSPKELIEEELRLHGSGASYKDDLAAEGPQHHVRITKPYWLGATDVTQEEYERVMGGNPSRFQGDPKRPVEQVSWNDAVEFCRRLSELPEEKGEKRQYRLPTEAQWEYVCRAGTTSRWYFGDDEAGVAGVAWVDTNAKFQTHSVGGKKPNAWGLYDMHGNVMQWCQDWYGKDYYAKSAMDDPAGPAGGSKRVGRGGSRLDPAWRCRSAVRWFKSPEGSVGCLGLRVCLVLADE